MRVKSTAWWSLPIETFLLPLVYFYDLSLILNLLLQQFLRSDCVLFSSLGFIVVICLRIGHSQVKFYDISGNGSTPVLSFDNAHSNNITAIGFQKQGRWMFTVSEDKKLKIWDIRTSGSCKRLLFFPAHSLIIFIDSISKGNEVVTSNKHLCLASKSSGADCGRSKRKFVCMGFDIKFSITIVSA